MLRFLFERLAGGLEVGMWKEGAWACSFVRVGIGRIEFEEKGGGEAGKGGEKRAGEDCWSGGEK